MTSTQKQEFTLKISQANKTAMITILYEMVLVYVGEAKEAFTTSDSKAFREAIRKIRGCIKELMGSVNLETELGMHFLELYIFMNRLLVRADIKFNVEPLEHVEKWISQLHDAYKQLEKQDTTGAVMGNAQEVYAGLTYGKEALTENLSDQGRNRGFQA